MVWKLGDMLKTGAISEADRHSLADCASDRAFTIARISDQNPEFLRFLKRHALVPGASVRVHGREPIGQTVTVRTRDGSTVSLGTAAAAKVLVEPAGAHR
jgi:Fe2+ transport system protein FeoA